MHTRQGMSRDGSRSGVVRWVGGTLVAAIVFNGSSGAQDAAKDPYPTMAPIAQYRISDRSDEITLARTAAPASISADAEIMVLGERGYETAVKGKNGFVCLVERSWSAPFDNAEFWNPKNRSPICLNAAAASTVLPVDLERTRWVLDGTTKAQLIERTKSSAVAHRAPAPGAMAYMLSKEGYLNDGTGHWHPHLMFYEAHSTASDWGANLPGSPVFAQEGGPGETTVLYVPVHKWSDGTLAASDGH